MKGVKKVFKKVLKPVAKLLNSKIGKIISIALTIWGGIGAIMSAMSAVGAGTATTFLQATGQAVTSAAKGFAKAFTDPAALAKTLKQFGANTWEKMVKFAGDVGTKIKDFGGNVAEAIQSPVEFTEKITNSAIDKVTEGFEKIKNATGFGESAATKGATGPAPGGGFGGGTGTGVGDATGMGGGGFGGDIGGQEIGGLGGSGSGGFGGSVTDAATGAASEAATAAAEPGFLRKGWDALGPYGKMKAVEGGFQFAGEYLSDPENEAQDKADAEYQNWLRMQGMPQTSAGFTAPQSYMDAIRNRQQYLQSSIGQFSRPYAPIQNPYAAGGLGGGLLAQAQSSGQQAQVPTVAALLPQQQQG